MRTLKQILKFIFLCGAPFLLALLALVFVCSDLLCRLKLKFRRKSGSADNGQPYQLPTHASIVIPNWNGKDLLEKFLPSVLEATSKDDEIIVVDNASSDGSAEFVRRRYPRVRVIEAESNLGFGGGSNLGMRVARHGVVVLLNNDMRAMPDFLQPLLDGFTDESVFAVSAQIFFSDPSRRREETGLTTGCFERGFLRVRHDIDEEIQKPYPVIYGGGGSTAYDRQKFLELGGFDPLFEPFYLEDTDISYCAWRRGWSILYQPKSRVFHEHRGTIGKHFTPAAIQAFLKKNYVLMVWKNVHRWRWLLRHFLYLYGHMFLSWAGGENETRTSIGAFLIALRALPQALRSRSRALSRATVDDLAVFERTRPSVYRDVFRSNANAGMTQTFSAPIPPDTDLPLRPLNILFVSPYSLSPPIHGGGVFMLEAVRELAKQHNVYVVTFVDREEEVASNLSLEGTVRKVKAYVRPEKPSRRFSIRSHAEEEFRDEHFAALLDKYVYLYDIDVIQFEYSQLAQYRLPIQHTPQCLFEHDVYFRSVARQLLSRRGGPIRKAQETLEWLRAIRFEIGAVGQFDAIFTCHEKEQRLLESFLNGRQPPIIPDLRAVIDVFSHAYPGGPREPDSLLFVGNFQHRPNVEGLQYFVHKVLPLIRAQRPSITLKAVGAQATPEVRQMFLSEGVDFLGQVPDIREPLSRYAVFVCPILSGAGMRVKILEAFASGIPVVSTSLGAEGVCSKHGAHLMVADSPRDFADATLTLLNDPGAAYEMAARARQLVETFYDWPAAASKLDGIYRQLIASKSPLAVQ